MSDHSRRHTKPTSEEVYQDAKRILEEYLKRKLSEHGEHGEGKNNNKQYARSESYKAASRENVVDKHVDHDMNEDEGISAGVERSKTMPSSYKIDKPKNGQSNIKLKTKKKGLRDGYSSAETDAEHSDDEYLHSHKRKKKSFFKRAKERLMHAIHRDIRSDDEDVDVYDESGEKKKRSKRKNKKKENSFHDSPDMNSGHLRIRETHTHIDQHISVGEEVERRKGLQVPGDNSSSLQDSHSSSSRRNSAGKKLLDSIRKSFRKNKRRDISESKSAEPVAPNDRDHSYSRSISTPDRSGHLDKDSLDIPSGSRSHASDRQSSRSRSSSKSKADVVVSQSIDHSQPRTVQVHGLHLNSDTLSSFVPAPPPPHFSGVIDSSVDLDVTELTLADDGLWERAVTSRTRETVTYHPQGSLEIDGKPDDDILYADEVDSPIDSQADKEEAIDRIVKKLIEIGDNLSSEGEARQSQESQGAVGGTARGDDRLSSLERDIINCLRQSGDVASSTIDGHANEFINGAVKEAVYEKFSTTLRQSVGDDVNWNQMALVFHATKSALKVAGAGSKMATQIKDLTLKYVTEKCASWIVDQGGWESILYVF